MLCPEVRDKLICHRTLQTVSQHSLRASQDSQHVPLLTNVTQDLLVRAQL